MKKRIIHIIPVFFAVILFSCSSKAHLSSKQNSHVIVNEDVVDSSAYKMILPYKQKMDLTMNDVLGKCDVDLTKDQPEGNLGNFVCDALYIMCKNYLGKDSSNLNGVLLNNGGLRTSLSKGEVTVGKIFELMPFDNELAFVELSGEKTQELFNFIAAKGGMPVSGISMTIDNQTAKNVLINGVPFDIKKHYYFISSDYLINGGDKMDFFKNPVRVIFLKKLLRDVLIDYCKTETKKGKTLTGKKDGRISIAK